MNKVSIGRRGEEAAVRILKANGYRILDRNFRARFGEIDLIARDGATLCFVEIKARTGIRFGWPEESVTALKQWKLIRLAKGYLRARRLGEPAVRFDVVSLLLDSAGSPTRSRLIKHAFDAF